MEVYLASNGSNLASNGSNLASNGKTKQIIEVL